MLNPRTFHIIHIFGAKSVQSVDSGIQFRIKMSDYRFKFEPYKEISTRHTCPACERHSVLLAI